MSLQTGNNDAGHDNQGFYRDTDNAQNNGRVENGSAIRNNQNIKPTSEKVPYEVEDDVDISCGIWKLRTNIFGRKFSNLYVFSICVGLSTFFAVMVQSVLSIHLTSIETQFKIDNTRAGLFDTSARIGSLTTILFAGHFAKKVHIPMVVGSAGVIQGMILMIPAFIQFADPYTLPIISEGNGHKSNQTNETDYGENGKYLCKIWQPEGNGTNGTHAPSSADSRHTNEIAFIVIVVVQAFKGVTDAFHAGFLPSLYVDDNVVEKTKMGIFFGINSVISELAQPVGKQINAVLTKIPVDLLPTKMDPRDPRFVAAWWMAFLVFGAGTVLFSIPIMLFPRRLVSTRQQEAALKKAMVTFTTGAMNAELVAEDGTINNDADRILTVKPKAGNSPMPGRNITKVNLSPRISQQSGSLDVHGILHTKRSSLIPPITGPSERRVSIDGTMIFEQPITPKAPSINEDPIQGSSKLKDLIRDFPRAFIRLFRRPVFVLIIFDIIIISIPMAGTAIFRSAYIKNEYNVPMADVAMLTGITQAVGQILGTVISGWLANRVKTKMGYNYLIIGTYVISMLITPIYIIFGCENQTIYGHDGDYGAYVNTTETCGCRDIKQLLSCGDDGNNYLSPCYAGCSSVEGKTFTNCSGLADLNGNLTMSLTPGICNTNCHSNYLLYVYLHAVQITLQSMSTIPRRLLILRIVDPKDRGFATSVFAFFSTVMAIPSPNLFGRFIDNTCLIWDGACVLYDRDQIRFLLSGLDIGVSIFLQFTMLLTIYFFRKEEKDLLKKIQKEEQEKQEAAKSNNNT